MLYVYLYKFLLFQMFLKIQALMGFNSSQRQNEFVLLLTLGLKPWVNIFPIAEFPMVATLRLTCGNVGGNYLYRYFSIRQRGSLTVQNHLYGFTL